MAWEKLTRARHGFGILEGAVEILVASAFRRSWIRCHTVIRARLTLVVAAAVFIFTRWTHCQRENETNRSKFESESNANDETIIQMHRRQELMSRSGLNQYVNQHGNQHGNRHGNRHGNQYENQYANRLWAELSWCCQQIDANCHFNVDELMQIGLQWLS